jgi:hypothetical protein
MYYGKYLAYVSFSELEDADTNEPIKVDNYVVKLFAPLSKIRSMSLYKPRNIGT